ncbi:rsbT co-antagonist protein RsbR [Caldanaerobius fijiensis DSM 17918]|uniref:RsbT co-antagonist protein RsbR n=1 Tax=Caldanaerobius fijiensis DSM 17918 TaxID=1121256 RepID=A0A1M5CXB9_9THEO|nr:STAS domain-containing protein [Caldanaerobius fijiensis]SHF59346.1 rsbT co-antagonist protein RsbR [Caldanaerobius fijiensis DSM 17918]
MKEAIISKIKELTEDISDNTDEKSAWEDFLVDMAEHIDSSDKSALKQSFSNILQFIDEKRFIDGLKRISENIDNFPLSEMLQITIEVMADTIAQKNDTIVELKNILSELETPVIRLWKKVLLVPIIGTLDSNRAQNMAEKILNSTSNIGATAVIIDVTGVSMIDTIVGGFLIETFNALKLLGCDVILTGIKPEVAQTLVKLNIDFNMVTVKRNVEYALSYLIGINKDESLKKASAKVGENYGK